ncbi:MAG: DUF4224 domain-containing protein [Gammaproteobacteria bacterium]
MFLNKKELSDLTGVKTKKKQVEWLSENKYRFTLNVVGWPKVLVREVESKLLSPAHRKKSVKIKEPNFDGINGR